MTNVESSLTSETASIEVHPSVIFKLGEDLITDSAQALAELIKNCYDADASYARVRIWTGGEPSIEITDDGVGMTLDQIKRGWLTVSNSIKREMKAKGQQTPKNRTPLGDKGLGRLGAQRLGSGVSIRTRPAGGDVEHAVAIDWKQVATSELLSSVKLEVLSRRPVLDPRGTTLRVDGLYDPQSWRDAMINEDSALQKQLSTIVSPYGERRGFKVLLSVDDIPLDLYKLPARVRDAAELHYKLDYKDQVLTIQGAASIDFFKPGRKASPQDWELFHQVMRGDGGDGFWRWLNQNRPGRVEEFHLTKADEPGKFAKYFNTTTLLEAGSARSKGEVADPGPFQGEIDSLDLDGDQPSAFDKKSEFRSYVRALQGIRVYRDGFGIRVDSDWLGLAKAVTSAPSFYSLKPENTLGYIDISARHNSQLVETTDREAFAATPHYANFISLLDYWLRFTGRAQSFLRRAYVDFIKENRLSSLGETQGASPEDVLTLVGQSVSQASVLKEQVDVLREQTSVVGSATTRIRKELGAEAGSFASLVLNPAVENAINDLARSGHASRAALQEASSVLAELDQRRAAVEVLQLQISQLREQLAATWEMAAVGLVAEALTHEVANIADSLITRTAAARRRLLSREPVDQPLLAYAEHVAASTSGLKKQLAHLNPAMRYAREKRDRIDLSEFCADLTAYHCERLSHTRIRVLFAGEPSCSSIKMNRGKLTQVLDNLIINSEFWLEEAVRQGLQAEPKIHLSVKGCRVKVWDNGRGVDPSVASSLFEPFVTTKRNGVGRGLGLYVVQQLLDLESSSIALLPERNMHGRRFVFEVNLEACRVD